MKLKSVVTSLSFGMSLVCMLPVLGQTNAPPAEDEQADLAEKLQSPVANLTSVPIQNNCDFGIGPANAMKNTANIQPVIPFTLNQDWNLITRTVLPVIYAESPVIGGAKHAVLGDTQQSFFFSPKNPVVGLILGTGPIGYYPTATETALGAGKWGAGPTIVALRQEHGFTYGIMVNQIWSFPGQQDRQNLNSTFLQPFVGHTAKTYTSFTVNTESSRDWENDQRTVPLNFMVQQLVTIGHQPVAFQDGYRYCADKPSGGPDWGLRFTVTFLSPPTSAQRVIELL